MSINPTPDSGPNGCDSPKRLRFWPLTRVTWTASLLALCLVPIVMTWAASRIIPAGPMRPEAALAFTATLDTLRTNSAGPRDAQALQEAASSLFVILNPALSRQESRRDPASLQAEAAAAASFLNPGAVHAQRMEDPSYRRRYQAAMESLQDQARETRLPIQPSATDARQIEALRNDPVWQRQRQEPMHALMPGGRIPPP